MAKKKKKEKFVLWLGGLIIVFSILIAVVGYLLYLVNQNLQQVQSDIFNVRATVSEQQKNSLNSPDNQLSEENLSQVEPSLYVNRSLGIQFQIPVSDKVKDGIIEDDGVVLFGPLEDFTGALLPKYSLRYYPNQNFSDYTARVRFVDEECDLVSSCLLFDFNYNEIDSDRDTAIKKIIEPFDLPGLQVWKYSVSNTCLIPTIIIYDQTKDCLFEFQEHCTEDENEKFKVLTEIVRSFTLL